MATVEVVSAQNALPQEKKVEDVVINSPPQAKEKAEKVAALEQPKVEAVEEQKPAAAAVEGENASTEEEQKSVTIPAAEAENAPLVEAKAEEDQQPEAENAAVQGDAETKDDDQAVEEVKEAVEKLELEESSKVVPKPVVEAKETNDAEVKEAKEEEVKDDAGEVEKPVEEGQVKLAAAPAEPDAEAPVAAIEADAA